MGPLLVDILLSQRVREQKSLVGVNIFCNTLLDPLKKSLAAPSVGDFHGGIRGRLPPKEGDGDRDESSGKLPQILLSRCLSRCLLSGATRGLSLVELVRIPASNFFQEVTETLKALGIISHEFRTARPPLQRCNHFTAQSLLNGSLEWLAA